MREDKFGISFNPRVGLLGPRRIFLNYTSDTASLRNEEKCNKTIVR